MLKKGTNLINISPERCEKFFQSQEVINVNYSKSTHKISWSNGKIYKIYSQKCTKMMKFKMINLKFFTFGSAQAIILNFLPDLTISF